MLLFICELKSTCCSKFKYLIFIVWHNHVLLELYLLCVNLFKFKFHLVQSLIVAKRSAIVCVSVQCDQVVSISASLSGHGEFSVYRCVLQ